MKQKKYDVFISYRRDLGADSAKHLHDKLTRMGYRVFFDTDSLRSGFFNTELLDVISNCKDFVIILTPGALDRCVNEDDWVRQELACAMAAGKNVIPILSSGFVFPDTLPEEINQVRFRSGITATTEYFDAVVQRLTQFLSVKPLPMKLLRRGLPALLGAILLVFAVYGAMHIFQQRGAGTFPANAKEKSIVDESVAYASVNMACLKTGYVHYDHVLADASGYCQGAVDAPSLDALIFEFDAYADEIDRQIPQIRDMSATLSEQITGTPLPKGDFLEMPDSIRLEMESMSHDLRYLKTLLCDDTYPLSTKAAIVAHKQRLSDLMKQGHFVAFNQMFADVDRAALKELILDQLPLMAPIYNGTTEWSSDSELLKSRERVLWEQIQSETNRFASIAGSEQLRLEREEMEAGEETVQDEITKVLTPEEEDNFSHLWTNLEFSMGENRPDMILLNLEAMERLAVEDFEQLLYQSAFRFTQQDTSPWSQGAIIVYIQNLADHPTLRAGDIITEVNGIPVDSAETIEAAASASPAPWQYTVLRANESGNLEACTVPVNAEDPAFRTFRIGPLFFDEE